MSTRASDLLTALAPSPKLLNDIPDIDQFFLSHHFRPSHLHALEYLGRGRRWEGDIDVNLSVPLDAPLYYKNTNACGEHRVFLDGQGKLPFNPRVFDQQPIYKSNGELVSKATFQFVEPLTAVQYACQFIDSPLCVDVSIPLLTLLVQHGATVDYNALVTQLINRRSPANPEIENFFMGVLASCFNTADIFSEFNCASNADLRFEKTKLLDIFYEAFNSEKPPSFNNFDPGHRWKETISCIRETEKKEIFIQLLISHLYRSYLNYSVKLKTALSQIFQDHGQSSNLANSFAEIIQDYTFDGSEFFPDWSRTTHLLKQTQNPVEKLFQFKKYLKGIHADTQCRLNIRFER
jgi:hypothetical protein